MFQIPIDSILTESRLLIGAIDRLGIRESILRVEFDVDGMIGSASIQASALDTSDIRHDFKLRVQGRPAGTTEEMFVYFARCACGIVCLDLVFPFRDVEVATWNDDIGCVCRAGPLLTVSAVAEGCGGGLAWV